MSYQALAIANEFLRAAEDAGRELTNMQLNKLVYIAHGWWLALTDNPLIGEQVEAWRWGPVVPTVYHEFKFFGSSPIPFGRRGVDDWADRVAVLEEDADTYKVRAVIDKVFRKYGALSGAKLSALTHEDGTPWSAARARPTGHDRFSRISDEDICAHYRAMLAT